MASLGIFWWCIYLVLGIFNEIKGKEYRFHGILGPV